MHVLILFDTKYGHTEKIAHQIADAFGDQATVQNVKDTTSEHLTAADVILCGSPIHNLKATETFRAFLENRKKQSLEGKKGAAFETGYAIKFAGNAAGYIIKKLGHLGCDIIADAERFIVLKSEGPLKDGEEERAREWGAMLKQKLQS